MLGLNGGVFGRDLCTEDIFEFHEYESSGDEGTHFAGGDEGTHIAGIGLDFEIIHCVGGGTEMERPNAVSSDVHVRAVALSSSGRRRQG